MKCKIGYYKADGNLFKLDLKEGKRPDWFALKSEAATPLVDWSEDDWCRRANGLASVDSFQNGIQGYADGVIIGTDARVNTAGVRYYWMAVWRDGSDDLETTQHMGNATAGREIMTVIDKMVAAAIIKRDSTRQAVVKVGTKPTAYLGGGVPVECVALHQRGMTLTAQNEVNEYNSAAGLGEGIRDIFIFQSDTCKIVSWSNTPAAGTIIGVDGDPLAALAFSTAGTALVARFLTRDMPAEVHAACPVDGTAMQLNEAALVDGGIRLGSATTLRTAGEITALVFCRSESIVERAPAVIVKKKKGVFLGGRGTQTYIDCGASDATLKIDGAMTIEWAGILKPSPGSLDADGTLLTRGAGPANTDGAYSYGLGIQHIADWGWSGPMFSGIVCGRFGTVAPLDQAVWRSGVNPNFGKFMHVILHHSGNGRWWLMVNGHLAQQRDRNLPQNVISGSGHRTLIGGRPNGGGAVSNFQRMIACLVRTYAGDFSLEDALARTERVLYGSTDVQDVTTGLREDWDFNSATNVLLPATVSASNNGTIVNGRIVTL